MDQSLIGYFKIIGEVQQCIAAAETLDEALQGSLRVIIDHAGADMGTIWYADKAAGDTLRPCYWIGPVDLTAASHEPGDGVVGQVYVTQQAQRAFDFASQRDAETVRDYEGVEIASMVCVPFSNTHEDLGCI